MLFRGRIKSNIKRRVERRQVLDKIDGVRQDPLTDWSKRHPDFRWQSFYSFYNLVISFQKPSELSCLNIRNAQHFLICSRSGHLFLL